MAEIELNELLQHRTAAIGEVEIRSILNEAFLAEFYIEVCRLFAEGATVSARRHDVIRKQLLLGFWLARLCDSDQSEISTATGQAVASHALANGWAWLWCQVAAE